MKSTHQNLKNINHNYQSQIFLKEIKKMKIKIFHFFRVKDNFFLKILSQSNCLNLILILAILHNLEKRNNLEKGNYQKLKLKIKIINNQLFNKKNNLNHNEIKKY